MSEPSQLFARVSLTRQAFTRFLAHVVSPAAIYDDWIDWLSAKRIYGGDSPDFLSRLIVEAAHDLSVDDWINNRAKEYKWDWGGPVLSEYDEGLQQWTFAVLDYSTNFGDFISAVNVIRQIDGFKDLGGTDYMAIVPLLFGSGFDSADVVVQICEGSSRLVSEAPGEFVAAAAAALGHLQETDPRD